MSRTRGRLCALVLLGVFALGNAGIVSLAIGAWRQAAGPASALPCHGVPADSEPQDDTGGCQWASPAACCDSPQNVDTRGADAPPPLVAWGWLPAQPAQATRASGPERALEPPLPVPRSWRVLQL